MKFGKRVVWWRLLLYVAVGSWLACDLWVFEGPIARWLEEARGEVEVVGDPLDVVVRVHAEPITKAELEHELAVYHWRRGQDPEDLTPDERALARRLVYFEVIDAHLLRIKARHNDIELKVDDKALEGEWRAFRSRFRDEETWNAELERHGITAEEMRLKLAARMQQVMLLDEMVAKDAEVSEEEMRAFFDQHRESLGRPERRRVRHLFAAALDHPDGKDKALVEAWVERLKAGESTWEELAKESEDLRSGTRGGELGWLVNGRGSREFDDAVFEMKPGESRMVSTSLGTHWVELLEVEQAQAADYDALRPQLEERMRAHKRKDALLHFRIVLRRDAEKDGNLEYYGDWISGDAE